MAPPVIFIIPFSRLSLAAVLASLLLVACFPVQAQFQFEGTLSARYDDTSTSEERGQYRLRLKPSYVIDSGISLHAFIATGDVYESAYNTIDDNDDEIHIRHLFARFKNDRGMLEFGSIPSFKERVSSTGLSKEGWVKGVRGVLQQKSGAIEVVLGSLEDLRARDALSLPDDLNYVEVEYSGTYTDRWLYEIGVDRMLGDNFLRGEVLYETADGVTWSLEAIRNASRDANKFVVSMERAFRFGSQLVGWSSFYAYADEDFGSRAALTEDFLEFGHALASELSGAIAGSERWAWVATAEIYEESVRGQFEVEFTFR